MKEVKYQKPSLLFINLYRKKMQEFQENISKNEDQTSGIVLDIYRGGKDVLRIVWVVEIGSNKE